MTGEGAIHGGSAGRAASFRPVLYALVLTALAFAALAAAGRPAEPSATATLEPEVSAAPELAFEPNAGRYGSAVDYLTRTAAGPATIGPGGVAFERRDASGEAATIRMGLAGADLSAAAAVERLPGVVNDLRGDDPSAWETGIPTFAGVTYESAWPGVDVDFHGSERLLRYDFRVAPGADPARIGLDFSGADSVRLSAAGDLVVRRDGAIVRQSAPVSFQRREGGGRDAVRSRFVLEGGGLVGIAVGDYDSSRELVIDPLVLGYSTFLGGLEDDVANGVAVGPDGSAYLTGVTSSDDLPGAAGNAEGDDAFVSKLAPGGSQLLWSTYIGGSGNDNANGIAVDSDGYAYIAGETLSEDFPVEDELYTNGGGQDAFVLRLGPNGDALDYSTYLAGGQGDSATSIAIDPTGAAYVAGATSSTDFPVRNRIYDKNGGEDAFVTKLAPGGASILYGTFIGGSSADSANGIAVDAAGAPYVAGSTASNDFPTDAPLEGNRGGVDAFVFKLNLAGTGVSWSTYIGGGQEDSANAVAVDDEGNTFVAGDTSSENLTLVAPFQTDQGGQDGFVVKLGDGAPALDYSTYLGGSEDDNVNAIAVDDEGRAHIGGLTGSADFPAIDSIVGRSSADDGFVTRLAADGSAPDFSTFLGGASRDIVQAVAVDDGGRVFAAGVSRSDDFPVRGAIQSDPVDPDFWDAFALRLDVSSDTLITSGPADGAIVATQDVQFGFTGSEDASFECSLDGATFAACTNPRSLTGLTEGEHSFEVRAVVGDIADPTPARRDFEVDVTDPETQIDTGPDEGSLVTIAAPEMTFSSNEQGSFECRVDADEFEDCETPWTEPLDDGEHVFEVRAVDRAGNVDETPASRSFEVDALDTDPPQTTILKHPKKKIKTRRGNVKVLFRFGSDEPGRFECSWDRSPFNRCSKRQIFKLRKGRHKLQVRAVDAAGNPDPTPARFKVRVMRKKRR